MFPERESIHFCEKCHRRLFDGEERKWHGLCKVCATDTLRAFQLLLWAMLQEERELLDDLFDGVSLNEFKEVKLE